MHKTIIFISIILLFGAGLLLAQQEELTITTLYPSPQGVYDGMVANRLGIGDNNGDNVLTSADAPPVGDNGEVWIAGNLGIGTTNPVARLQISGNITNNSPRPLYIQMDSSAVNLHTAVFANAARYGVAIGAYPTDTVGTISAYRFTNGFGGTNATLVLQGNGGSLGIRDEDPDGAFEINPDISEDSNPADEFVVRGTGAVGIRDRAPDGVFEVNPDGVEDNNDAFVVQAQPVAGRVRVGIGTVAPAANAGLDVQNSEGTGNTGSIITHNYFFRNTGGVLAPPPVYDGWINMGGDDMYFNLTRATAGRGFHFLSPGGMSGVSRMSIMSDGTVITRGGTLEHQGADFKLGTNDGRPVGAVSSQRALVHDNGDVLAINFANDFEGGTRIDGNLLVTGATTMNVGWEKVSEARSGADFNGTATCSAGKKLLGGGCNLDCGSGTFLYKSAPDDDTTWACRYSVPIVPGCVDFTVYAICAAIQ